MKKNKNSYITEENLIVFFEKKNIINKCNNNFRLFLCKMHKK